MKRARAAVIGSGFGGLALAIRLQAAGFETVVFEKRDRPGGRAYVYQDAGFTFDAGPTVITAPECLQDLFELRRHASRIAHPRTGDKLHQPTDCLHLSHSRSAHGLQSERARPADDPGPDEAPGIRLPLDRATLDGLTAISGVDAAPGRHRPLSRRAG